MDRPATSPVRTRPARAIAVLALTLVAPAVVLAGCSTSLRPIASLPPPVREQVPVNVGPGEFRMRAVSTRVVPGQRYHYKAFTHCGFTATTFDFDGSYWQVVGPGDDGNGNPLAGIGNPIDVGTIELTASDSPIFTSAAGVRISLVRGPSEARTFGCD